jgi:cytochrome P450
METMEPPGPSVGSSMEPEELAEAFMDPAVAAEPQPFYREARSMGPVVPGVFGQQIVRRTAVEYALGHPEEFSSGMEAVDLGQSVPLIPLQVDPPEHRKYRRLLDPIFAPRFMNVLEPDITRWINERIDTFIDAGCCDFAADFAVPLPSSVFLRLVGLPLSELDMFLEMKDGILRPLGNDLDEIKVNQQVAARRIEEYFAEQITDRQKKPRDDLLSMFLSAEVDSERLTVEEILGICFLFVIAGLDTVTDSLECFMARLAQHPDERRQLVEDPEIIPTAVEELLRWETPVTTVARVATRDIELEGCPIHKGESIGVMIGSANTDELAIEGADEVDLTRGVNRHLAFGGGVHRCLGSNLARVELRTAMREWHRRIPEYSLEPGAELVYQMGLRQIDTLPLVFDGAQ